MTERPLVRQQVEELGERSRKGWGTGQSMTASTSARTNIKDDQAATRASSFVRRGETGAGDPASGAADSPRTASPSSEAPTRAECRSGGLRAADGNSVVGMGQNVVGERVSPARDGSNVGSKFVNRITPLCLSIDVAETESGGRRTGKGKRGRDIAT